MKKKPTKTTLRGKQTVSKSKKKAKRKTQRASRRMNRKAGL